MRAKLLCCLFVLAPISLHAAELTVDAGALRATLASDPWRITFTDASGAPVLAEATDSGSGPSGPLGFRTASGWVHAVRASNVTQAGNSITAEADTNDTLGRRLTVRLARDSDGVISLTARIGGTTADVEALGIGFDAAADERFFGFGERANALEHRGSVVESYVSDGPYDPSDRALIGQVLPPPGYRDRDDATYFPIPWLLSSRGYGVLVDNRETVYHRLATERPDAWSLEVVGAPIDTPLAPPPPQQLKLRVFAGPTPADALRRFSARIGRQPRAAAPWVFGPWYQPGGSIDEQVEQLQRLRAADAPASVSQTFFHYLPCGGDRSGEPRRTQAMHALGFAVTTYFNPMLCDEYHPVYERAVATGAFTRKANGEPYIYRYVTSRVFFVGQFDFTAPAGRILYRELLRDAIADGHDGWMEDFGEYTPLDSYTLDGRDGTTMHNRYVVDYHCIAYALTRVQERPIVRYQRSGWTGAARCAQVVWSGDPTSQWGYDGLASVVTTGLGMGLSGISTWGSDIGGFFGFFKQLTSEMLMRWVQLGAFTGVMRTERDGLAIPSYVRPQVDDPDQLANWRRWAKVRTQLYPYLVGAESEYRFKGLPIMRHLLLHWPNDPEAVQRDDEYLFGADLLVAPVLAPGLTSRDAYLPAGDWIDLWRALAYDEVSGGLILGSAQVIGGGQTVTVPAPPDEVPVFARAGTILPLLPADVDTLADYGAGTPDLVRLADRLDQLQLIVFPRGTSSARAFRGERYQSIEGDQRWELALDGNRTRTWTLQASLATLNRPFTASSVEFAGAPVADWSFDDATKVLRATFVGQRGRLVVD